MNAHKKLIKQRAHVESLERMGAGRVSSKVLREARRDLVAIEGRREYEMMEARDKADLAWRKEIARIRKEGSQKEKEKLEEELRIRKKVNKAFAEGWTE